MIKKLITTKKSQLRSTFLDRVSQIKGWTRKEQLDYLMRQVKKLPDNGIIVEVGVWQGRSAIAMGEACRGTGKRVFAIDPWIDFETKKGVLSSRLNEFGVDSIESVYHSFLDNISKFNVEQYVRPVRKTSVAAAYTWSHGKPDFVFIDGNHNYEPVLSDLRIWTKLARKGAVIVGDDWGIDSVQSAVKDFLVSNPKLVLKLPCVNTWEFKKV